MDFKFFHKAPTAGGGVAQFRREPFQKPQPAVSTAACHDVGLRFRQNLYVGDAVAEVFGNVNFSDVS